MNVVTKEDLEDLQSEGEDLGRSELIKKASTLTLGVKSKAFVVHVINTFDTKVRTIDSKLIDDISGAPHHSAQSTPAEVVKFLEEHEGEKVFLREFRKPI